jgi:anti-anti-sigma regulatory factor
MKEVKIIFVDVLADAGEPDAGFLILTSDGKLYKGNGTASPEQIYDSVNFQPFFLPKSLKTSTYTLVDTDTVILCYGTFTVNLPTVDGHGENAYIIKNIGSGTITVDGFSTQTIDGSTTKTLLENESILIRTIDNSTGWAILADKVTGSTTPNLQQVTDADNVTTNWLISTGGIQVSDTTNTHSLVNMFNVSNSYGEIVLSNVTGTIQQTLTNDAINFKNNGNNQLIIPYSAISSYAEFMLPNVTSDKYIPVTVKINGTPTSANSSGVIDLGTISGGSGITRSVNASQSGSVTAGATALTDYVYIFTGAGTLTLPTAVGNTNRYTIKNRHSSSITVAFTSGQNADGSTSISIAPYQSLDFISDNANYNII